VDDIVPIGLYAIQRGFSDAHQHGIYPWEILSALNNP